MGRFSNLKSRLMLLVLIALAPVVLLILYSDVKHRRSIETDLRNNLSSLNFLAKDNLNRFFDTTRLLLITLSQTAEVRKGSYSSISAFFRNLHKNYPDYYLSIKLDWLKRLVTDIKLSKGYAFTITDRKGIILSRHPEPEKWTGKLIPEAPMISAMLSQKNGIAEIAGLDGVKRMYAFSTAGYGENHIYVAVGMSKEAALKKSNQILLIDLLLLIVVGGTGLVIAHIFSHSVILRPIKALKNAAENITRGNFNVRTGFVGRTDELGSLAGIFDNMAEAVEKEISVRKKAEEALQESERHFRETLENVKLVSVLLDLNGCVTFCNDFLLQLTGYSHDEVVGMDWFSIFVPKVRPDVKGEFLRGLREGNIAPFFENPIRTKDGTERLIRFSNTLLRDGDGQVIGTTSIGEDITERKKAEETMNRNERVLQLFVEHSPAAIAMFDRNMKYIVASRRFLMDYELGGRNIIGRSHYEVFPEIPERWREIHRRCLSGAVEKSEEDPFPRADGRMDWVRWEIHPWYETEGEIGGIILFSEVITERKRAEEELKKHHEHLEELVKERTASLTAKTNELDENQSALLNLVEDLHRKSDELAIARERAEAADRIKSAFLATMSHELRTPLNSIIGFTGILLQGLVGALNKEQNKQLKMVQDSANHLLALINDILDIFKIEAGQVKIVAKRFDMPALIRKIIEKFMPLAEKKGVGLTARIAADVGTIVSNRRRVEQILINLLGNAVKFTEQGEVRLECAIECGGKDAWMVTRVTDTGIGIKREDMDMIFKPFQQIDSGITRQYEGTGLGLSICKQLVELLGGTIWAESEWGKGSAFAFTLPLQKE